MTDIPNWGAILIGFIITWAIWVTIEVMKFKDVRTDMVELRRTLNGFISTEIQILKELVKKENGG